MQKFLGKKYNASIKIHYLFRKFRSFFVRKFQKNL